MKKYIKVLSIAIVAIMMLSMLVACGPNSNPDKALAALEKNEYKADKDTTLVPNMVKVLGIKDVTCVVSGTKLVEVDGEDKLEHVTIFYFLTADAAEAAWDKLEDYAEDDKEKDDDDADWVYARSGAIIYYGTKAGVAAAR